MSLFVVQGLVKRFGALLATDHVSLEVRPGEIHALIGPNGAGKSTFVNLISGLHQPDAGRIELDGTDLTPLTMDARIRAGLSRCFQITSIFPKATVLDNLLLAVQAQSGSSLRFLADRGRDQGLADAARALAARVGLAHALPRIAGTLPHGAQRQLDVALALAARPKLLLLDEPAAGLTAGEVDELRDVLLRLHEELKLTMVVVEHNMRFVMKTCSDLAVLSFGRKLAQGSPEEVANNDAVLDAYLGGVL